VTAAPTNLTSSSVTLSGYVNPNGFATDAFIQFGMTSAFGSELARQSVGNGIAPANVQTTIGNLVAGTTYYYRMVAINSEGSASYGTAQTFRAVAPVTAAPTISSVLPSLVIGSNNEQPLIINGSNFVSGANITLRDKSTGEMLSNRIASSFSSTQIIINPRLTTAAATWSVNVVNPDGASTGEHVFQVVAPPVASPSSLSFTGLTPTSITATAKPFDAMLTASGSNFNNVNKIVWVASGASTGTFTWTKFGGSWVDAFGVAKAVLADTDISMRMTPRLVGSNDTWSGTTNWTVTLTDTAGLTATKTFTVNYTPTTTTTTPALSITTIAFNPATATVGVGYGAMQAVTATGGQTPYSCSASGLPSGMAMNTSTCAIYGTPTVSGTYYVTVTVYDSSSPQKTVSKVLTLTVSPAATAALSITTTALPSATVGTGYAQGVAVSGGQTPYTWYVSSGLPSGLYINSTTGAIYGTPTVSGTFYFTVTAYDSSSPQKVASQALSLNVGSAVVALTVNGVASSYIGTGQKTIPLTGSGFNSLSQISWSCTNPNGTICTGSPYVWTPGTARWSNVTITSDTVATVYPTFLVASDPVGTYNWSVTFSGGGQSVTKYFTAIK